MTLTGSGGRRFREVRVPGDAGGPGQPEQGPAARVRARGRRRNEPARADAGRGRFAPRVFPLEDRTLLSLQPTNTVLAVAAAAAYGQPVTLTATVADTPPGTSTPTGGTVTFWDGSTMVGSAALGSGTAALTLSTFSLGAHTLTAKYGGDGLNFAPSNSAGTLTTVAGNGVIGYNGDNIPASAAQLYAPEAVAVDSAGNVYIADTYNQRIREIVKATGQIITVAGNGSVGYNGDNIPATAASLYYPEGVAVDGAGNVYIADSSNERIREVVKATGQIITVAGSGISGYSGDNGPATSASLNYPEAVAVDSAGNVYISDTYNQRIREVVKTTNNIITVAGNGNVGYAGDGGLATSASLDYPRGLAVDSAGNLYIADTNSGRIREVVQGTGQITTVAGNGIFNYAGDGGLATSAALAYPQGVAVDSAGNLYIADTSSSRIRKVDRTTGVISTVAGNGNFAYNGDNIPTTSASLYYPEGVAVDGAGNVYIADTDNERVREVSQATGQITTLAGEGPGYWSGDNGPATAAQLYSPSSVAVDSAGNIYIADTNNNRIREVVKATGQIITVAGIGTPGYNGDHIPAASASLNYPRGVAVDSAGNLYIADTNNLRIREVVKATGQIITVAGNGGYGYNGDNFLATSASLAYPQGVAVDSAGNIYIADTYNQRIREVLKTTGNITTVAGYGYAGYGGDNFPATSASLNYPQGVAVDSAGNVYIADTDNQRVREVVRTTSIITTVAGNGSPAYNGDNFPAAFAALAYPQGVAVDSANNLYIADSDNQRIREVVRSTGNITTVAGNGNYGYSGDGNPATASSLDVPQGVTVDGSGTIYIADTGNQRIRSFSPLGTVLTVSAAATTTTLATSAPSDVYGGSVTFTATVAANAPSAATPTGTVQFQIDGNDFGAPVSLVNGSATSGSISTLAAGSHTVTAVYAASTNFVAGTPASLAQTVARAPLTVTANDASKVYGDPNPALSATLAGFVNGDTPSALSGTLDLATTADASSHVLAAGYPITPSGLASDNYNITYVAGTLQVTPATLNVAADPQTKVYGQPDPALSYHLSGLVNGDSALSVLTGSLSRDPGESVAGGPYAIALGSLAPDSDYTIAYTGNSLTITPAPLTISADNLHKDYGAPLPTLTASYSGLVNGDTPASLDTAPSLATTADASSHVSGNPYAITASGAVDSNYTIAYLPGTLTVDPVSLAITADNQTMTYGGPLPALSASYAGLVNGDTPGVLTGLSLATAPADSAAGTYPITVGGAIDSDYTISYTDGNLTIGRATLTITADSKTMTYGGPLPALSASYAGLVNGDTPSALSGTLDLATTADASSHVLAAGYPITPSGLASDNYTITYVAGTLQVTPATLNVAADPQTKVYGQPDPALSYHVSGLVNGDTSLSVLTGSLSRDPGESVAGGPYAIALGSLAPDPDYTIAYTGNSLTITPAALDVTPANAMRDYGATDPLLSGTILGVVPGDDISATYASTDTAASPVGDYPITATLIDPNGALANYTVTLHTGTLTIDPRAVTVTADPQTKLYGDADPNLTYSITAGSLVNGDSFSGALTRAPGENVGNYAIQIGSLSLGDNYDLTFAGANLTVSPRPITVTADPQTKLYGDADPSLTYTITAGSLASGDSFSGALTRAPGENVGNYAIQLGSLSLGDNYDLTFAGANFTVSPRPVTVTADPQTKLYGDADPSLTYSITAGSLASGDGFSGALTRAPGENVGNYAIQIGSLSLGDNYDLTFAGANLTVSPRPITVTADPQTKLYGDADPSLTYSITAGSLAGGDSFSGALTRAPGENVGNYPIQIGSLSLGDNYDLNFAGANLVISPRPITVTADSQAKVFGASDPSLTYEVTAGSLGGGDSFSGSLTRAPGESVGSYPINQSTLTAGANYALTYVGANFTITQASTVTTVASSANPAVAGQAVTFTAVVSAVSPGGGVPAGSVVFAIDSIVVATVPLAQVGGVNQASFTATGLLAGSHQVTATFVNSDGNDQGSSASLGQAVLGPGVYVSGTTLFIVGANTSDSADIGAAGGGSDGSTGLKVVSVLNHVASSKTFKQPFTAIVIAGYGGNDDVELDPRLALAATVSEGNGNDFLQLGDGNNTVTAGNGNDHVIAGDGDNTITLGQGNDSVIAGNGDNTVTVGDGNDVILLGNGDNIVVEGKGNDLVAAGNGANLVVAGLGKHAVVLGNGNNILVDGSVALTQPGDTLRSVLTDWNTSAATTVNQRLSVTYNVAHPSILIAGNGRDWFFSTNPRTMTNRKATDRLN